MGALRLAVAALLLALAPPAVGQSRDTLGVYVAEASARFGIPVDWIWRVMAIESGGRTTVNGRPIRSPKGAMGLMQLMPSTWQQMRGAYGLGTDPDDPHDNIVAGTAYLRLMYDRFGYPGLFGAYNAGPDRYEAFLAGRPLPAETKRYLRAARMSNGADRAPVGPFTMPIPTEPASGAAIFAIRPSTNSGDDK